MRRFVIAPAMLCILAAPAGAQDGLLRSCVNQSNQLEEIAAGARDQVQAQFEFMCAQVVNAFQTVQPSVGIAFSGGNPTLGTATTLGTRLGLLPRLSVTARANVAFAKVPDLFGYAGVLDSAGAQLPAMATLGVPVGSLQADVALGLFNGLSFGPTVGGVGAIDLLGSVALLPQVQDVGLDQSIRNIGVGAKIGLLKQGLLIPGVSVSAMYRRMGDISFGDLDAGDPGAFTTDLETLSLRAVVSKGIAVLDFAIGGGYDRYSSDLSLDWRLECPQCPNSSGGTGATLEGTIAGELATSAWNVFGNVALDLLVLNVVAEAGYQKATDVLDVDALGDAGLPSQPLTTELLSGGRPFGSVGLRLSF